MDKQEKDILVKTSLKRWLILIAFTLVGIWIIQNLNTVGNILNCIKKVIFPFILGGSIAFILNIPMSFFERKMKKIKNKKILRMLSIIFAIIVILLVIAIVITLIVPRLAEVINLLIDNMPYYTEEINKILGKSDLQFIDINNLNINVESMKEQIINQIPKLLNISISIVTNVISAISNFVIAIIFAIYILIDKEKLSIQTQKLLNTYLEKKKVEKIINIAKVSSNIFRKFFTVQCLEASILGILCIIVMLILRIPYAVPIGVLIGVTALVPIVGAFIGIMVGAILIVSVNPIKVVTFVIAVLILQQIEGNVIYPKVVGNSVGLPGMWVLVAVTIGGSIGGILGMLLGVPIATTIYNLLKEKINKAENNKLNEQKKAIIQK